MSEAEGLDDVVTEFLIESYGNLDQLDRDLIALEQDPGSRDVLASVFRTIHTLKGTCGFLGFGKLEAVAHVGESLLALLRDGKLHLDAERTSALLTMVDAVRQMLASIEATGSEGERDDEALIDTLTRLQHANPAPAPEAAPESRLTLESTDPEPAAIDDDPVPLVVEDESEHALALATPSPEAAPATNVTPAAAPASHPDAGPAPAAGTVTDTDIRVDVALLDKLMNLVGELVLARNQILQCSAGHADSNFVAASQRLNLIATELQESVMKTRMQPIGTIWSKLPRVVRDLSVTCGRRINLELEGRDTELDKTIIEAIKDPLTHLVCNAVDHGIEPPDVRTAAGKPADGRLILRAYHEGGLVSIEIRDDGAGIHPEKLKRKALERRLISPEQAARMGERELLKLIFLPGFSTAGKVTNVSGRGVGMDVVRTNIERIGGSIDVQSTIGVGTTFKINIPLTLAIIPALIVTSGTERYAIPQVNLRELLRIEAEAAREQIEDIHGAPVYRLRGHLLPLVYLDEQLGLQRRPDAASKAVNIIALQAGEVQFGLVVDEVNDTEEIVVKPLAKQLKSIAAFSGATIRGDGRVALILDVLGLAQHAHVLRQGSTNDVGDSADSDQREQVPQETLLLVAMGESDRVAMPLGHVGRLEEFPATKVEHVGGREVVQYDGTIMPLLHLGDVLGQGGGHRGDTLQVVVYSSGRRHIGIVVDRILDIVSESVMVQGGSGRPGVVGSAVIQQRATDLLDVAALVRGYDSSLFDGTPEAHDQPGG